MASSKTTAALERCIARCLDPALAHELGLLRDAILEDEAAPSHLPDLGGDEPAFVAVGDYESREDYCFEHGWRTAAKWAERGDLVFDIDSPAYRNERDIALGRQP